MWSTQLIHPNCIYSIGIFNKKLLYLYVIIAAQNIKMLMQLNIDELGTSKSVGCGYENVMNEDIYYLLVKRMGRLDTN